MPEPSSSSNLVCSACGAAWVVPAGDSGQPVDSCLGCGGELRAAEDSPEAEEQD